MKNSSKGARPQRSQKQRDEARPARASAAAKGTKGKARVRDSRTERWEARDNAKPTRGDKPLRPGDKPLRPGDKPARSGDKPTRTGDKRTGDKRHGPKLGGTKFVGAKFSAPKKKPTQAGDKPARPHSKEIGKPIALTRVGTEPHPGMWLFTTREGSEQDLVDELQLAKVFEPGPRVLGPSLVLSPKLPRREGRPMELTFARQGFEIVQAVKSHDLDEVTQRTTRSLKNKLSESEQYALHVWVPDSQIGNPLASLAEELDQRIERALAAALPNLRRIDDATLRRLGNVHLAQVAVLDGERFAAGVMYGNRTPSLAKGGRTRVRVKGDLPSRAARKIEEALAWIGVGPGPGEVCADLGAAPGGWTYVLADRRARVIAVDPAKLRPDVLAMKGVRHVMESAFTFAPDEQIDWLFCDMAWRPLEAAALLAKWGRRKWARILVANIKLPMVKKVEILTRVKKILEEEGEWKHVRSKQLYHDRDEITLTAVRA